MVIVLFCLNELSFRLKFECSLICCVLYLAHEVFLKGNLHYY